MLSIIKSGFILLSIILFQVDGQAQQFTKITTGAIVTTPSGSRSCNFLDINNDNLQDILITNGTTGGEDNMLYLNNGGGSFTLLSGPVVEDNTPTDGATCADFDNDGFIDVFAVNWYNIDNLLYQNNGGISFLELDTSIAASQMGFSETASWGDFDNDGLLDLYVTNSDGLNINFLYHNLGDGHFQAVTGVVPVIGNFFSRCVNWIDYDGDGDQDIYVTNQNDQPNNLYRNNGDMTFTSVEGDPIVLGNRTTMSGSWADFDNDGDFDLFLSNYEQTNQLFRNDGTGNFLTVPGPWNTDVGCSFSSSFADYDNDGDLDLFVTNGFCSFNLNNYFYINNGDGTFTKDEVEPLSTETGGSYGCAWGDYDNNGFMDLVVANWQGETQPNFLFRNDGNDNNWIKIKLEGTVSNRSAIGAVVRCKSTIDGQEIWQTRVVSAQSGYCSQNSLVVHFGIGDASSIDSLEINWPSGIVQVFEDLNIKQFYTLIENESISVTGVFNPFPSIKDIKVFPNPTDGQFAIELAELKNGAGEVLIFDSKGAMVMSKSVKLDGNGYAIIKSELPTGVYFIQMIVEGMTRYSGKLLIGE